MKYFTFFSAPGFLELLGKDINIKCMILYQKRNKYSRNFKMIERKTQNTETRDHFDEKVVSKFITKTYLLPTNLFFFIYTMANSNEHDNSL
jgi:hypothetical protein